MQNLIYWSVFSYQSGQIAQLCNANVAGQDENDRTSGRRVGKRIRIAVLMDLGLLRSVGQKDDMPFACRVVEGTCREVVNWRTKEESEDRVRRNKVLGLGRGIGSRVRAHG